MGALREGYWANHRPEMFGTRRRVTALYKNPPSGTLATPSKLRHFQCRSDAIQIGLLLEPQSRAVSKGLAFLRFMCYRFA